jgi:tetratricopeptide (TPR) repeat protein
MASAQYAQAVPALEKLSEINPKSFQILGSLGAMHAKLGNLDKARLTLERAIQINPDNPYLWHNLGNVRKELGDTSGAEKAYEKEREYAKKQGLDTTIFDPSKGWNLTS